MDVGPNYMWMSMETDGTPSVSMAQEVFIANLPILPCFEDLLEEGIGDFSCSESCEGAISLMQHSYLRKAVHLALYSVSTVREQPASRPFQ